MSGSPLGGLTSQNDVLRFDPALSCAVLHYSAAKSSLSNGGGET